MPPIRTRRNLYQGINAHLHSHWQAAGGWNGFHTSHIVYLTTALKVALLPLGYTAEIEASLQIRRFEKTHQAVAVRGHGQSEPVVWIELLSPSNKPGGQDAERFREKRLQLLDAGIVFVELDYLHESAPTIAGTPHYSALVGTDTHEETHAFRIVVIDPRPDLWQAQGRVTEFDVNSAIPTVNIPLGAGDVLAFDFNAPYQNTFSDMLYGWELVDYAQLPRHFERYSQADRARILSLLLAVRAHHAAGDDLETVPLNIVALSLADARARWGV